VTSLADNLLLLPEYHILGTKVEEHDLHLQVEAPDPVACEGCGVESEFVRFGKRDVAYRDLPIRGKRVTLWVVRRRYTCRMRIPANVTGHSGDRDRFAHSSLAGSGFVS